MTVEKTCRYFYATRIKLSRPSLKFVASHRKFGSEHQQQQQRIIGLRHFFEKESESNA
jgi:hypothetical protein